MSSFSLVLITLGSVFGGAALGLFLRSVLPQKHLAKETKDAVGRAAVRTHKTKVQYPDLVDKIRSAAIVCLVANRRPLPHDPQTCEPRRLPPLHPAIRQEE